MTQRNKTLVEYIKKLPWSVKIVVICLSPAIALSIVMSLIMIFLFFIGAGIDKNNLMATEDISDVVYDSEQNNSELEENWEEKEKEARKAEEEEKARLAEEEKAKKAAEEAEKQRQEEAALQEKKARASAAFANPLGHKGEIIAVTGTITVDYAYRKNDTKKYTTKLPAGTKDGWGGFWIDTQYGKCYAEYSGYGPKKDYNSGDTVTFVGRVVSDESTFEPMNGIVAPLWIDATEDF